MHREFMPPWAEEVCVAWRRVLDSLRAGPDSIGTTLDWSIKLPLYMDRVRRRGIAWDSLPKWNYVLTTLCAAIERTEYRRTPLQLEFVLGKESPIRPQVDQLNSYVAGNGLSWDGLGRILSLRQELCEIDMRFGELRGNGIFAALDRAGVLTHHVDGIDGIESATTQPPRNGRAHWRGEFIQKFTDQNHRFRCEWDFIWDRFENRLLDLSEPFPPKPEWRSLPALTSPDDVRGELRSFMVR